MRGFTLALIKALGSLILAAAFFTVFTGALLLITVTALENHKPYKGSYYARTE